MGKQSAYRAKVRVTLKKSVLDPQGKTVLHALHSLGFKEADALRVGKYFDLNLQAGSKQDAESRVRAMCDKLFINPVIEEYEFDVTEAG